MFTHHGTHIIGLTAASKHVAMALQPATIISFETTERNWWLLCCWGPPVEHHGRPLRTSGGGVAPNTKASITTRAADVHGRC